MENHNKRYGLLTAIAMIVGVCIGSGIFFKSDNILVATGGSIPLGVLVFVFGAVAIVFGGLCMSELASRTDRAGGVITYAEDFAGKRIACGIGWFHSFVYYPTLIVVVAQAFGVYLCALFNLQGSFLFQMLLGFAFFTICYLFNTLSPKLGGIFQNAATIIKLIPLVVIAVLGIFFGDPVGGLQNMDGQTVVSTAWIAAIGPISYSYDGWITSTSIAHEIRNSKRNLPIALIFAPLFIMIIYVLYFVGVSSYLGPQQVMALGDDHVAIIAQSFLGGFGAKAIMIFVVISVMGTINGLILGYIRLPYSLALRERMMPFSKHLSQENERLQMPVNSAIFAYIMTVVWLLIHIITQEFQLLPNSDVSEISIAVNYLIFIIMYYQVYRINWKGEHKSVWRGIIVPIFAVIGSLLVVWGGLQNVLFPFYAGFCLLVFFVAILYYNAQLKKGRELGNS